MRAVVKRVLNRLLLPFERHFPLVVFLTLALGGMYEYLYISNGEFCVKKLHVLVFSFAMAYVVALFCSLLRGRMARRSLIAIVCFIAYFYFCITFYCCQVLLTPFTKEIGEIILGTNPGEASDFLSNVGLSAVLSLAVFSAAFFLLCLALRKIRIGKSVAALLFAAAFAGLFVPLVAPDSLRYTILEFFNMEKRINLKDYEKDVKVVVESDCRPDKIVLVIGESHSSLHNSLSGYEMPTNPNLEKLRASGRLLVMDNVVSPATYTVASFKYMMTTMKKTSADQEEWYRFTTLPFVMRKAGYKTFWLSNQCKVGIFDNIVSSFSELCDSSVFIGNSFEAGLHVSMDGGLIKTLENCLTKDSAKQFVVVHLYGSHVEYADRFPKEFERFRPEDYPLKKEHQRQRLADYDNSILYTDFVVSQLMRKCEGTSSVVVYLSDHGEDVFASSENYCGHGIESIPESFSAGTKIPFMVFASEKLMESDEGFLGRVESGVGNGFCTEDLIYFLMKVAGLSPNL